MTDKKIAFVHIPKTGGTTVNKILIRYFGRMSFEEGLTKNSIARRHWTKHQLIEHDQSFSDFFWFCFVRNPWERMVSEWRYHLMQASDDKVENLISEAAHLAIERGLPSIEAEDLEEARIKTGVFFYQDFKEFAEFAIKRCESERTFWDNHWRPQSDFIDDSMDFIGRMEEYEADVKRVFSLLGISKIGKIPKRNASGPKIDYRTLYDTRTRDMVGEFYSEDIRQFGYSF
jgi:hypothetical protein